MPSPFNEYFASYCVNVRTFLRLFNTSFCAPPILLTPYFRSFALHVPSSSLGRIGFIKNPSFKKNGQTQSLIGIHIETKHIFVKQRDPLPSRKNQITTAEKCEREKETACHHSSSGAGGGRDSGRGRV